MKNFKQMLLTLVILATSFSAGAATQKCQPVEVKKSSQKFRSLEFTLGEAEVDFKRLDPDYRNLLNETVAKSLENLRKSKVSTPAIEEKAQALRAAMEDFNRRPDEELDSTVTLALAQFAKVFSQNPEVDFELANSTLKAQMLLKRGQAAWAQKYQAKNKIFSQYVKAMNDYQEMQKACRVGRYQD